MKQVKLSGVLLGLFWMSSCATTRAPTPQVSWDDLTSSKQHHDTTPVPRVELNEWTAPREKPTKPDMSIDQLTRGFKISGAKPYEGGVYGKSGDLTVFAAPRNKIPDYDRLYWVMVKVLSEKYGCFIRKKQATPLKVSVLCRDKRTVVFYRNTGDHWIQFYGRQYDQTGQELIVRNRQIISLK